MSASATRRRHHVVIVGCGFGGLFAAKTLRRAEVDVTVIDRTNHHLFQPLLYLLAGAFQRKILPPIPIVLDSPMTIKATEIYVKHAELFDEDASAMWRSGELSANLHTFRTSVTGQASRALNHGGAIVQGQKDVKVLGEAMRVNAKVHTLGGLSGHAGGTDLLRWFDAIAPSRPRVVLTHGEDKARTSLARDLAERHGIEAELPGLFDVIEARPAAEMGADRWHGAGAWRLEGDRR